MALPVVIAKNQTGSPIFLSRLGLTVPASPATITLTDFASFYEISWEADLQTPVGNGNIIINDGSSDLSAAAALGYLDATGNLNGPVSGLTANALLRLSGTTGRYTKSSGITVDDSDNLTTTGNINASGGAFVFPTSAAPTPTVEGQTYWDSDDNVLRVGNGVGTTTLLTELSSTLQIAYNNGPSINTAGSTPITFTLLSGGFTVDGPGAVNIGADATAQTLNVGTGGAVKTVTVGSTNSTSSLTLNSGTGNIDIGTGPQARTVNLGTGSAVVQTINIGGTGANVIAIGNTQTAGSVSVGAAMTTGTINVGGTGAQTGTINLGVGTGAQAINLATGGTGAKTVTVGSTASTSSMTVQSGTGAMTFTAGDGFDVNATTAVTIDSSGGTIGIGTDAVAQAINIGTGAAARTITVGNTTGATALNLTAGTGNTNVNTAFTLNGVISPATLTGTAQNDYNPTGLSTASTIRQNATSNTTITGLAGGVNGRVIIFQNISAANNLVFTSQDLASTAANRLAMSGTLTLTPNDCVIFSYDGGSSRWMVSGTGIVTSAAAAGSLQTAYNGGPSITTASSVPITFTLTSGGFVVNGTGTVDVGADATAQTINLGTGAAAKTVTVGSSNTTSTLNLTAGTGNVNTTSAMAWNGVISPTSLSTSQNDYNPTNLSTASTIRQDASAAVNITGLAGGVSGRIIVFYNISAANAITLVSESASSTAANRFTLPLNVRLAPSDSIILQYDGTTSRWRAPATSKGTVSGVQKSRFYQFAANAATAKGDHNTVAIGANGSLNLELMIPDDFTTLVSIQAIMIPGATNATANIDLASDYAAIGELFNANSETNTTNTYALTTQQMTGIDLSSVATNIAAGDFFGVTISHNSIGAAANYLGALLRYT